MLSEGSLGFPRSLTWFLDFWGHLEPSDPVLELLEHFSIEFGLENTLFATLTGFRQFFAA